jgi:hypothetical protein
MRRYPPPQTTRRERLYYAIFRMWPHSVAERRIAALARLEAEYADDPRGLVTALRAEINRY